jgi:hypothetical protein
MDNYSIFDLTDEQIKFKGKIIAQNERNKAWAKGLPISYRNEKCTQDDMIIHEYSTGEKRLVSVSPENGNVKTLRNL